jgi:hypothetical protein
MFLCNVTTDKSWAISVQIAGNLPIACVGAATCTRSVQRKGTFLQHHIAAIASWKKERHNIPPTIGAAGMKRKKHKEGNPREHPRLRLEGCSLPPLPPQLCPSQRLIEAAQRKRSDHIYTRIQSQV